MEDKAGNHEVDSALPSCGFRLRGIDDDAAARLQQEREDVRPDEDDAVRLEAGEIFAIDDHDAGEAEVDACAKKARCDNETSEISRQQISQISYRTGRGYCLHQEGVHRERIEMQVNPGSIPDNFKELASNESC